MSDKFDASGLSKQAKTVITLKDIQKILARRATLPSGHRGVN